MSLPDRASQLSKYEELLAQNEGRATTRPTLTEEERKRRRAVSSRLSMEARRRASAVLIDQHRAEYLELYNEEKVALLQEDRYRLD